MEKRSRCAVVFDSGIGGLNLLSECSKRIRGIRYYYISDGDNMPYGNKSGEEILALTLKALEGIGELKPLALVIACNTVTANCIGELRARLPYPVVGIQPAVKQAAEFGGKCLVLATNATVASRSFIGLVRATKNLEAEVVGCRGLAEYIDKNIFNLTGELPEELLPDAAPDCVVLGCTHYTFVKKQIGEKYGCPVFDGTGATADHFAKIVGKNNHFAPLLGKNDRFDLKQANITFLGKNFERNSQIFNQFFKTNV